MKLLFAAVASLGGSLAAAAAITAGQTPLANNELAVPGDNPLTFCEKPDGDILTITNVDLEPNPPQKLKTPWLTRYNRGKDLLITATGTLSEAVEEGSYVLLQVKFGLIKLVNLNESLCEQLKKVDRECPLDEGELIFQRTVTLPNEIPPGKFNVFADVYSKDGKRITCMEAKDISFYQSSGDYIKGMLEL